jgi:hypothetical protein
VPFTASTVVTTAPRGDAARNPGIGHQGLQNGCWIGEPAGLDHHAGERRDAAGVAAPQKIAERRREVVADLAAQAPGLQRDETVLARFDQIVVDADVAEFVDDDGGPRKFRLAQQATEQGRLAAAEETGEKERLDHVCTRGTAAIRARIVA